MYFRQLVDNAYFPMGPIMLTSQEIAEIFNFNLPEYVVTLLYKHIKTLTYSRELVLEQLNSIQKNVREKSINLIPCIEWLQEGITLNWLFECSKDLKAKFDILISYLPRLQEKGFTINEITTVNASKFDQ